MHDESKMPVVTEILTCSMRRLMGSWVSWPLWLMACIACSLPLVEACMLQYTRSPPAPVTLMQGPSTSPALRKGPLRLLAGTGAAVASVSAMEA